MTSTAQDRGSASEGSSIRYWGRIDAYFVPKGRAGLIVGRFFKPAGRFGKPAHKTWRLLGRRSRAGKAITGEALFRKGTDRARAGFSDRNTKRNDALAVKANTETNDQPIVFRVRKVKLRQYAMIFSQ